MADLVTMAPSAYATSVSSITNPTARSALGGGLGSLVSLPNAPSLSDCPMILGKSIPEGA